MSTDPYEILGVKTTATADEIKKAYRKLARSSHPDLNPDDPAAEARFKAVSNAYDLLKDPDTRARFDRGEIDATGADALVTSCSDCRETFADAQRHFEWRTTPQSLLEIIADHLARE